MPSERGAETSLNWRRADRKFVGVSCDVSWTARERCAGERSGRAFRTCNQDDSWLSPAPSSVRQKDELERQRWNSQT